MIIDIAALEMDSPKAAEYLREQVNKLKYEIMDDEMRHELDTIGVSAKEIAALCAEQEEIERRRPKPFDIADWIAD